MRSPCLQRNRTHVCSVQIGECVSKYLFGYSHFFIYLYIPELNKLENNKNPEIIGHRPIGFHNDDIVVVFNTSNSKPHLARLKFHVAVRNCIARM